MANRSLVPGLCMLLLVALAFAEEPAKPTMPPVRSSVDVIAVTPVDATGIDRDKYPANVQRITPDRDNAVADSLVERAASIVRNDSDGSRWQPDIQFRGFVASPVLGSSEGLAVFQDGVRINEPFGDVVNWDALSDIAISTVDVIPGSNATFGLNALGGVIVMRTKSGFSDPGTMFSASGGSFGRGDAALASGWQRDATAFFIAAAQQHDDGWRDFSPSRRDNLFGSGVWSRTNGSSDVRLLVADDNLTGNGASPVQLLNEDRSAVFTYPDNTRNRLFSLTSSHDLLSPIGQWQFTGYARNSRTRTTNGDDSPYEPCDDDGTVLCLPDSDELVLDQGGQPFTISDDQPLDAVLNRTDTRQSTFGATAQLMRDGKVRGLANRWIVGASLDAGREEFGSHAELADLTPSRGTIGVQRIAEDSVVRLAAHTQTVSAYVTDLVELAPALSVIAAARFNDSTMHLMDREGTALNGDHRFTSVNPSIGATYAMTSQATIFASLGQSSRTPTPVELTCADADDPCRLPNAFVSDPSLDQVIARTIELGVREHWQAMNWSLAAFRTVNSDDILFISSGPVRGEGHFANVGETRRQGIELTASGHLGRAVDWFVNGTLTDATFQHDSTIASPLNPLSIEGEVQVQRGDRLPLTPRQSGNAGLTWRAADSTALTAAIRAVSSAYFRGDEGNDDAPLPGYAVLDASASRALAPHVTLQLTVRNVLDRHYATFGIFGNASEVLGDAYDDPRFLSPGEPRSFTLGVIYRR